MDLIILGLLFLVVLGLHFYEKKKLLEQIKDLSDKVYFTKTNDFMTNKAVDDEIKETPKQEEQFVPLEDADPVDLRKAIYGE